MYRLRRKEKKGFRFQKNIISNQVVVKESSVHSYSHLKCNKCVCEELYYKTIIRLHWYYTLFIEYYSNVTEQYAEQN